MALNIFGPKVRTKNVCVCVCVCVFMYVYVYECECVCVCLCVWMCMFMLMVMVMYMCLYLCLCMFMYLYMYECLYADGTLLCSETQNTFDLCKLYRPGSIIIALALWYLWISKNLHLLDSVVYKFCRQFVCCFQTNSSKTKNN